jgi:hypothetical protein
VSETILGQATLPSPWAWVTRLDSLNDARLPTPVAVGVGNAVAVGVGVGIKALPHGVKVRSRLMRDTMTGKANVGSFRSIPS